MLFVIPVHIIYIFLTSHSRSNCAFNNRVLTNVYLCEVQLSTNQLHKILHNVYDYYDSVVVSDENKILTKFLRCRFSLLEMNASFINNMLFS